ncbi:uncharacterized protein ACDP82_002644 [Pangshura tecta]
MNLGEHQLSNPSPTRISSPVRHIVRHPDVALVQLTEPVNFTGTICPRLPAGPLHPLPSRGKVLGHGLGPHRIGVWRCASAAPGASAAAGFSRGRVDLRDALGELQTAEPTHDAVRQGPRCPEWPLQG